MAQDNIYTMTPGSAVADTLQDILAKQEAQKRQAFLDQVNSMNVASTIQDRNENAETMKEYRAGLVADRKSKADDRAATQSRYKALQDMASQQGYTGDPVEDNMWRTIEADPEKGMQMYQAWLTHQLTERGKPKKGGEVFLVNHKGEITDTGNWNAGHEGDQYIQLGNEQQPNSATVPTLYYVDEVDPNDPTKKISVAHWLKPGEAPAPTNRMIRPETLNPPPPPTNIVGPNPPDTSVVPGGVRHGNLLPTKTPPGVVPQHLIDAYVSALKNTGAGAANARMVTRSAMFGGITDPVVKADIAELFAPQTGVFATSPEAKAMTADELINSGIITGTQAQLDAIRYVLNLIPKELR